eukprot:jgi/Tetstr1/429132/TSEL_019094.t1
MSDWLSTLARLVGVALAAGTSWSSHSLRKVAASAANAIGTPLSHIRYQVSWATNSDVVLDNIDPNVLPPPGAWLFFGHIAPLPHSHVQHDFAAVAFPRAPSRGGRRRLQALAWRFRAFAERRMTELVRSWDDARTKAFYAGHARQRRTDADLFAALLVGTADTVVALVEDGELSRAAGRLSSKGMGDLSDHVILAQLRDKHPSRSHPIPNAAYDIPVDEAALTVDMRVPYQQLKQHVAAGPSGMRNEYLRCLVGEYAPASGPAAVRAISEVASMYLQGRLPGWFNQLFASARLVAPVKKLGEGRAPDVRHVAVGEAERRAAERAVVDNMKEAYVSYSRQNMDLFVCEIDGMDQDKTCLPHLVPWDKEVEKKNLLQCHLTCVKYNGSQPDEVYYFFDCFPHDISNTITVMYKTIKKEIERRGEALDTVWFQLDNACRENKNKHTHERADQVFSKFPVWLDDHAAFTKAQLLHELRQAFTPTCNFMEHEEVLDMKTWLGNCLPRQGHVLNTVTSNQFVIRQSEAVVGGVRSALYCSRWSDTAERSPEFILCGVPDGTPAYLASRPLYHSKADPGKAFAEMEKEIWKAADRLHFSADERREREEEFASLQELETRGRTPFLAFWPESTTEMDTWLGALLPGTDLDADDPIAGGGRKRLQQRLNTRTRPIARQTVRRGGGQEIAIPLENEDSTTRREFDARPGNLVVMDNIADNPDAYRKEALLGDWENKYLVAYVRNQYDVHDLDVLPEDHTEVDELDVAMCEPWLSTPQGTPDIPLTFAIAAARQSRKPDMDSSW